VESSEFSNRMLQKYDEIESLFQKIVNLRESVLASKSVESVRQIMGRIALCHQFESVKIYDDLVNPDLLKKMLRGTVGYFEAVSSSREGIEGLESIEGKYHQQVYIHKETGLPLMKKIDLENSSRIIMLSDLHGHIWDLYNLLRKLQREGVLDENFRLKSEFCENTIFLFLGDYGDGGSPWSLLYLLMGFFRENNANVIM